MNLTAVSAHFERGHLGRPMGCRQWVWFLGLMMVTLSALGGTIEVSADRNPVSQGESLTVTFSAEESPDGDPDFSPLRNDFDILSQSSGSQFSIDNGKFSRTTEWSLVLSPKRAGNLTIPAIAFGKDRSQPLPIQVQAVAAKSPGGGGDADTGLLLEFEAEPKNPYVQAQVILKVRVLRRVNITDANLPDPVITDALVQRLAEDRQYNVERDGQTYMAIERRFALFPQKSGPLHIDPLTLEAQIASGVRSRFNTFFPPARLTRIQSNALDLEVRPVPAEFSGKHWLPAENLSVEQAWSKTPPSTTAGEPLTRTITLRARGATVGVLPELGVASVPAEIRAYADQPTLREEKRADGVTSLRQEKVALVPTRAGGQKLPGIEIAWWNTNTERLEIARLPEQAIEVQAASGSGPVQPPIAAEIGSSTTAAPPLPPAAAESVSVLQNPWFWASGLFGLAWLGTALAWWRISSSRQGGKTASPPPDLTNNPSALRTTLLQACAANDPQQARAALMHWINTLSPKARLTANELEQRLGRVFIQEMETLERALYAQGESTWRGDNLARLVSEWRNPAEPAHRQAPNLLEPLYKN